MKYKNIFWGIFLILLGGMYILKKLDVIWFSWRDIISLWPLLLILWGISLLPLKSLYKLLASFLAILIMILIISFNPGRWHSGWLWIGDYNHHKGNTEINRSEAISEDAEFATLELNAAAGSYLISGTTDQLVDFTHIGDSGTYYMRTALEDNQYHVRIGPENKVKQFSWYNSHEVDIRLNPDLRWALDIDAGAANIEFDLTEYVVDKLIIDGGASSMYVKLGSRSNDLEVRIETGVSSVHIEVPKDVACEVNSDSFLVSRELPDFQKVSKNTYVSPDFASYKKNISISFESGISSLKVIRY